ncbi:MAG TPA: PilZ domain-containing protein [Candidatus Hydrogenedentes bacterium]|nr:PilZ domain-containing protein [Candidatus Hydrogenedentota bacterium]HRK33707.1 PilZ domain-containing protein [Candidatus Hydrogenedentota bacterium]
MSRYDVNAAWSDPFEPKKSNQRDSERFKFRIKISITAQSGNPPQRLVGPGIVRNVSVSGALLITKHRLELGQKVVVAIPTKRFAVSDYLPNVFMGPAVVSRVQPDTEGRMWVAIRFGDQLTQNMEFASFIQGLYSLREALTRMDDVPDE